MAMWRWQDRHTSALKKTRHALGIETVGEAVIRTLLGCTYIVVVWTVMGPAAGQGELALKVAAAAAPFILAVALYIFNLVAFSVDFQRAFRRQRLILAIAIGLSVAAAGMWGWYSYIHFRSPIAWGYDGAHFGPNISGSLRRAGAPVEIYVDGFSFGGCNRSEKAIKRIEASITLESSKITFPLYVPDGQWIPLEDIRAFPPDVPFTIGCQMRNEGPHCGEFVRVMTPEQFLRDVGAFEFTVTLDGKTWRYPFSIRAIEKYIENKGTVLTEILNRPIDGHHRLERTS